MKAEHADRIVLHVAGPDRPGVTAQLTAVIAEEHAVLVDIGQSTLHGYLMLSAIVDASPSSNALRKILFAVSALGLRVDIAPFRTEERAPSVGARQALCVTLIGELGNGIATARITRFLADRGLNISDIRSLSEGSLSGLELIAELSDGKPMSESDLVAIRGSLLSLSGELSIDMAVQKDDLFRRQKRLVCLDVDSTFVKGECIDELAEMMGVKDQVADITRRAMLGELDFRTALFERVRLIEGLEVEKAHELVKKIELSPGADVFVRTLKKLGFRVGLVSGGFDFFVDALQRQFGLDFAFANELQVEGGRFTGRVEGTVVDPERKAQILKDTAKVYEVPMEQTIAIGDGANDKLMLQSAGLGIAYHAKPKLQEVADMSLNHTEGLDSLLYLMGLNARELRSIR